MDVYKDTQDTLLTACARDLLKEDLAIARSTDTTNTEVSAKVLRRIRRTIRNYDAEFRWSSVPVLFRRSWRRS